MSSSTVLIAGCSGVGCSGPARELRVERLLYNEEVYTAGTSQRINLGPGKRLRIFRASNNEHNLPPAQGYFSWELSDPEYGALVEAVRQARLLSRRSPTGVQPSPQGQVSFFLDTGTEQHGFSLGPDTDDDLRALIRLLRQHAATATQHPEQTLELGGSREGLIVRSTGSSAARIVVDDPDMGLSARLYTNDGATRVLLPHTVRDSQHQPVRGVVSLAPGEELRVTPDTPLTPGEVFFQLFFAHEKLARSPVTYRIELR